MGHCRFAIGELHRVHNSPVSSLAPWVVAASVGSPSRTQRPINCTLTTHPSLWGGQAGQRLAAAWEKGPHPGTSPCGLPARRLCPHLGRLAHQQALAGPAAACPSPWAPGPASRWTACSTRYAAGSTRTARTAAAIAWTRVPQCESRHSRLMIGQGDLPAACSAPHVVRPAHAARLLQEHDHQRHPGHGGRGLLVSGFRGLPLPWTQASLGARAGGRAAAVSSWTA